MVGTTAALSRANGRGQTVFSAPTETCKDAMQGQDHAVSRCPGVRVATGSPTCEFARYVHVWHTVNGNRSHVQGPLLLVRLLS